MDKKNGKIQPVEIQETVVSSDSQTDEAMVGSVQERIKEMEARRLLDHLDHAMIPDSICELSLGAIADMIASPWKLCKKQPQEIADFISSKNRVWSKSNYRILIEGGTERQRKKMFDYCLYRAILAHFDNFSYSVRFYDWASILPILADFKNPNRFGCMESMAKIRVLGLNEIDVTSSLRVANDIGAILTSTLRRRFMAHLPTVITLTKPTKESEQNYEAGTEINGLIQEGYDEADGGVIRIKVK